MSVMDGRLRADRAVRHASSRRVFADSTTCSLSKLLSLLFFEPSTQVHCRSRPP